MADKDKPKKVMVKIKKPLSEKPKEEVAKLSKTAIIDTKGVENRNLSDLKADVKYVQKGVENAKGERGSYIYYKDPAKGVNVDTDRDFVKEDNMPSANQTNKMRKYNSTNKRYNK